MREQARQHRRHQRHAGNVPAVERIAHRLPRRIAAAGAPGRRTARCAPGSTGRRRGTAACRQASAARTTGPSRSSAATALAWKLRQLRQAPLARPEVPEVNSIASVASSATSSAPVASRGCAQASGNDEHDGTAVDLQPGSGRSQLRESPIAGRAQQPAGPRIRELLRQLTRREPQVERQHRASREHDGEEPGRELACIRRAAARSARRRGAACCR